MILLMIQKKQKMRPNVTRQFYNNYELSGDG